MDFFQYGVKIQADLNIRNPNYLYNYQFHQETKQKYIRVIHKNRLPRDVMEAPSSKTSKVGLAQALSNLL